MKKQLLKSALIAVAGVGLLAGSAMANFHGGNCADGLCDYLGGTTVDYSAQYDDIVKFNDTTTTYQWVFNLDTWLDPNWDINAGDLITSATLFIDFWDTDTNKEKARIRADYGFAGNWVVTGSGTDYLSDFVDEFGLLQMISLLDHQLIVTVDNSKLKDGTFGTFDVRGVALVGEYCDLTPVPEPTTMLLFGAGLAGLAAVGRRRRAN